MNCLIFPIHVEIVQLPRTRPLRRPWRISPAFPYTAYGQRDVNPHRLATEIYSLEIRLPDFRAGVHLQLRFTLPDRGTRRRTAARR